MHIVRSVCLRVAGDQIGASLHDEIWLTSLANAHSGLGGRQLQGARVRRQEPVRFHVAHLHPWDVVLSAMVLRVERDLPSRRRRQVRPRGLVLCCCLALQPELAWAPVTSSRLLLPLFLSTSLLACAPALSRTSNDRPLMPSSRHAVAICMLELVPGRTGRNGALLLL